MVAYQEGYLRRFGIFSLTLLPKSTPCVTIPSWIPAAFRVIAAPAVATGQTAARTLLSCMRRPTRCAHHQGPPKATQTPRCIPARQANPKSSKVAETKGDLTAQCFRVANSATHTNKTLMLLELETLLAEVPTDAPAKTYREAIVEENVMGKHTLSTRKETASRLTALQGLDPNKPLFRVLRRLLDVDPTAHPQLALWVQCNRFSEIRRHGLE